MTATASAVEQLLERLLPGAAGCAASAVGPALVQQLTPHERALVADAREARLAEFAAGRACARRALAAVGVTADTIGRGHRGQPLWPDRVTGSVTHTDGLAAAAAVHVTDEVLGLGIDLARVDSLDEELWPHVLTPVERRACERSDAPRAAASAVFSAKEAAFKAIDPLLGVDLDFLDAHTDLRAGAGRVDVPGLGATIAARHGTTDALVVSVALVTHLGRGS